VSLKIYNSLSKEKETFLPLHHPFVGMYVCGPTVSGESHLGHSRPYITFDIVYRYLQFLGYKVRYVRNITDAGHFEEEGREAIDKVAEKSKLEKLEPMELVQKYTNMYHDAMDMLGNARPTIEPTATGHIVEQISMINTLIEKGMAYEINGSVYFDVNKYAKENEYGKLSGRILEDMMSGSRELDNQAEKRNVVDFALWKKASPEHIMRWVSPWGEGFPGWHIECSAMATKYLGTQFDIHGGGMDLLFPHHESEIAQSHICNGIAPVKYWMHNNMITVNGKKMGKSYNNTISLMQMFSGQHHLLTQAYSPMTVRFLILQSHYRSTLDFSNEALQAAEKGLDRLMAAYKIINEWPINELKTNTLPLDQKVENLAADCHNYINDDFNTAMVLGNLFELASIINSLKNNQISKEEISNNALLKIKETYVQFITNIFGLQVENKQEDTKLDNVIQLLINLRKEAKEKKDYATSDAIRNRLIENGIQLKDEKDGTVTWATT
jgi:cysteinyl-tRNA synthetase